MGVLKDLYNIVNDNLDELNFDLDDIIEDDDEPKHGLNRVSRGASFDSIAKQSKHGVMQFPVLASRSLSFDNIQMAAKACERNFAHLLQVIFTMNQISDDGDPIQYIKRFHQNTSTSVNGASDVLSFVFNSDLSPAERNTIMQNVKEGAVTFEEICTLDSLNSKYIPKDVKVTFSMEAKEKNQQIDNYNDYSNRTQTHNHYERSGGGKNNAVAFDPKYNLPEKMFVDGDVKKANEIVPTLMHVRILRDRPGETPQFIDFIVGVKAMIHPLTSEEIVKHMVDIFQDRGTLFKLITWTTGEINFFKDLIFNVDKIKDEIKETRAGKASTWWTALKNIKAKRRLHKYTKRDPVLPNATILLSMEEVDYIKANYGFDIMEDVSGKKILEALNLLQISVLDSATEVMYSFIDGSEHWELVTFKGLERDAGNADKQFKDILKAVNKLQ